MLSDVQQSLPVAAAAPPSVALYVGGFEAIGGIEACFQDLAIGLSKSDIDLSLFVWAKALPQLDAIARSGTRVYRGGLRSGCRWGLPDAALYLRYGHHLMRADKIVFGKFPSERVLRRMVKMLDRRPMGRPALQYITAYRPAELWPEGLPALVSDYIDTMIVQSADFTRDLRAMGFAGRIVEIPYLPPVAPPQPVAEPPQERRCRLGFLGRFVPQKNLFYLLDIIERLGGDAVELHMFGAGEHDAQLREEVAKRGLPVVFHGAVLRDDVPHAIDGCDIFLNPSISEGQCLVALEVLSRGRPFLASAVGAIPHILSRGRFGAVLPLGDASAAAGVVRRVMSEWRAGSWAPADVVRGYRVAYRPEAILAEYAAVFADRVASAHMAIAS